MNPISELAYYPKLQVEADRVVGMSSIKWSTSFGSYDEAGPKLGEKIMQNLTLPHRISTKNIKPMANFKLSGIESYLQCEHFKLEGVPELR